jgi:heme exporter protein D
MLGCTENYAFARWIAFFPVHLFTCMPLQAPRAVAAAGRTTTALIAICLALPAVASGQPPMLLPNRAYRAYWTGRGELPTGILRPFLQHMWVRPYVVYALIDAAVTAWVLGQVFGVWVAVRRLYFAAVLSIGLCLGLDLHMRRRFLEAVARQQQQQQQMRQQRRQV